MTDRERLDEIKAGLCCEDARELEAIARRALDRAEKAEAALRGTESNGEPPADNGGR